jgi:hypothetical protein
VQSSRNEEIEAGILPPMIEMAAALGVIFNNTGMLVFGSKIAGIFRRWQLIAAILRPIVYLWCGGARCRICRFMSL